MFYLFLFKIEKENVNNHVVESVGNFLLLKSYPSDVDNVIPVINRTALSTIVLLILTVFSCVFTHRFCKRTVNSILKDIEEKEARQMKFRLEGKNIKSIIEAECKMSQVNPIELRNGSRRKKVSSVRRKIAYRSLEELGLSCAEIARNLGVNTSAIAKIISNYENS